MKNKEYVWAHMESYKSSILGITDDGKYKQNRYSHILPNCHKYMNVLDVYRESCIKYIQDNRIKLHAYFHHLTSSQAVAINFFYPFIEEKRIDLILKLFDVSGEVDEVKFEKILDANENTNFDFYISLVGGRKILFEIKYTEEGFGKAKADSTHLCKFEKIYKYKMYTFMKKQFITAENTFKHYQLIRNVSYIESCQDNLLFVICPWWNVTIKRELDKFLDQVDCSLIKERVRLLYWEDILDKMKIILSLSSGDGVGNLQSVMSKFEEKYCEVEMRV